ncbi:helix-turn-helix transcriptional regulator [Neobacillus cucumis]|uniref:helix-turn-helix domain-containing protein n=1 Tax=Neobacillus cucumis TaxID=1740721 RepID=UPI002E22B162|nr:helix-turn-helix transcriptional regulator [Neobacillus cucumis]
MGFSEYLKEKRIDKKLSIRKLAEMSDVSAMYISELERAKRENPSPEVLKKLSKGLDEPYENLMKEAGYWVYKWKEQNENNNYLDYINQLTEKRINETCEFPEKIIRTRVLPEKQFDDLDYLLSSEHEIFFKERLLTKIEKTKIKNIIRIVLEE